MEDAGILPLYWQKLYWAAHKGFIVDPDRGEVDIGAVRLAGQVTGSGRRLRTSVPVGRTRRC